jgi:hypothetical protein
MREFLRVLSLLQPKAPHVPLTNIFPRLSVFLNGPGNCPMAFPV